MAFYVMTVVLLHRFTNVYFQPTMDLERMRWMRQACCTSHGACVLVESQMLGV